MIHIKAQVQANTKEQPTEAEWLSQKRSINRNIIISAICTASNAGLAIHHAINSLNYHLHYGIWYNIGGALATFIVTMLHIKKLRSWKERYRIHRLIENIGTNPFSSN